ncbi:MAG: hypothetical protein ACRD9R_16955, partial [Pyrinomonadaceae bacterium]
GTTEAESWKAAVGDLVRFSSPEVEFITGPQLKSGSALNPAPWFDQNAISKGMSHGEAFPAQPPDGRNGDAIDAYLNFNYYDQALCQYVNYYRTGDARFLGYARKIADSWALSHHWQRLAAGDFDNSLAPRNASLTGMTLRALDGRPELWAEITAYVRHSFQTWVGARVSYEGFYYGIRDGGYMLLHAANLARVHPDPAVREEFRAKVLNAAVNYYARLQAADGGFYFDLDDIAKTTQPFQVGILAEGLIAVHRLTGDERIKRAILKSAEHQFNRAYNQSRWRGMYYFVGGKGADGKSCETGCGMADTFPPPDPNTVREVRQLNATSVHAFGYAYLISRDARFRAWGDEIFDATFSQRDGYYGLADFRAKEYNQSYRSAGRYLAWRLSHGETQTTGQRPAATSPTSAPAEATAGTTTTPRGLVAAALAEALRQSSGGAPSEAQLQALLAQIEGARKAFTDKRDQFLTPAEVLGELKAAYDHAQNALLITKSPNGSGEDAKLRVGWAAARLKRAGERIKPRAGQ